MKLCDLRIGVRLGLGFGVILLSLVVVIVCSMTGIRKVENNLNAIVVVDVEKMKSTQIYERKNEEINQNELFLIIDFESRLLRFYGFGTSSPTILKEEPF